MSVHIKTGDAWHTCASVHVNVSGTWHTCRQVYVNVSGTWHKCLQNTSTVTVNGPGLGGTVNISNVTVGARVTVSGKYHTAYIEQVKSGNTSRTSLPMLVVDFTGCSDSSKSGKYNGDVDVDFSFSTTATSSNISVQLRTKHSIGNKYHPSNYHNKGKLKSCKITYTTTGYFD